MLCLSIETSCDETSLAILYNSDFESSLSKNFVDYLNSFEVLGHIISSQIDLHKKFGGVIPEIGAREHATQIHFLFEQVLDKTLQNWNKLETKSAKTSEINSQNKLQTQIETKSETQISVDQNSLQNSQISNKIIQKNSSDNSQDNSNLSNFVNPKINSKKDSNEQKMTLTDVFVNLDYIFVTTAPGLGSALKVGVEFAKTLEFFILQNYHKKVKIVPINHLQGHLASSFWHKT